MRKVTDLEKQYMSYMGIGHVKQIDIPDLEVNHSAKEVARQHPELTHEEVQARAAARVAYKYHGQPTKVIHPASSGISYVAVQGNPGPQGEKGDKGDAGEVSYAKVNKIDLILKIAIILLLLVLCVKHAHSQIKFIQFRDVNNTQIATYRDHLIFQCGTNLNCTPGSGGIIVVTASGSGGPGTPGGSNTQLQFNDGGIFGGSTVGTYIKASTQFNFQVGTHFQFLDSTDPTKIVQLDASNIATGATRQFQWPNGNSIAVVPQTCTNQVVTAITLGTTLCTTITSAYTTGTFPASGHGLLSATHTDTGAHTPPILGDTIYADVTQTWKALAGNTTSTRQFLTQTGTGAVSANPAWATIAAADLPGGSNSTTVNTNTCTLGGSCNIRIDQLAAAGTSKTFANGVNALVFNNATTTAGAVGVTLGETTAATGTGTPYEERVTTLIGSTATPLEVDNSLNGSQILPTLAILPTWNTSGIVDAALLINATNTASGTGSLLFDAQIGGVSQASIDKTGNTKTNLLTTTGAGGGAWTCTEGTAPTPASGKDAVYCDSTAHALLSNNNNENGGVFEALIRMNGSIVVGDVLSIQSGTEAKDSSIASANVTQNSSSFTTNQIPKASGAHTLVNSALSDNGTQVSTTEPVDMTTQPIMQDCPNDTITGTTNNLLAKLSSTGCIKTAVSDTTTPIYIVVSGGATSGSSQLAFGGQASCKMDATASNTEGFFVINSTGTAGDCHAQSAVPTGTFVVGTLLSNSTTSGSNASVAVNPYFVNTAGGGSGTVNSGTTPQLAYYASSTNAVSATGASLTWASPALTVGVNASSTGQVLLANGNASGASVTHQNPATTVAYNFNDPTTAGSTGSVFLSGGGGSAPNTWLAPGVTGQVARATSSGAPVYIDFPATFYVPAANCVNATAGSGWSTGATPASLCRAGTNNKGGLLSPWGASDTASFIIHLPNDWDSGASLDISIDLTSTDATNGHTIIMQAATACYKGDGSTTDDVAYNTAQSFGTITLNGNANRTWNATLAGLTKTGCTAGSTLSIKISRTTDTATNVGVYGATVDVARLLVVQAN